MATAGSGAGVVRRMPDDLANQIAAGEVVERPASAVKELAENALDAGATKIRVDLEEGGLRLIRVSDDGVGMSREDAQLAVERHATSKLYDRTGLFDIRTLGFRGEALPSIASVSRFELLTRPRGTLGGTRIRIEGGRGLEVTEAGAPPGTEVVVRELFFNTPARLKFLKARGTELKHVIEVIERLALPNPGVSFLLTHNGRTTLDLPAVRHPRDRVLGVVGTEDADGIFPTGEAEVDGVRAWGHFSQPSVTRRSTAGIWTFVNGRFVRDKTLMAAVKMAYEGMIDRARHPVVVLNLSVPPTEVDVNVHPMKIEVRFRSTDAVFRATRRVLSQALAATPWVGAGGTGGVSEAPGAGRSSVPIPGPRPESEGAPSPVQGDFLRVEVAIPSRPAAPAEGARWSETPTRSFRLDRGAAEATPSRPQAAFPGGGMGAGSPTPRGGVVGDVGVTRGERVWEEGGPVAGEAAVEGASAGSPSGTSGLPVQGYFASLTWIGQYRGLYLLCSDREGLVVIDSHAAHERITFERLRESWKDRRAVSQPLLFPHVLQLDAVRAATLSESIPFFERLGFRIEPYGGRDFALLEVPSLVAGGRLESLVRDALDELGEYGASSRFEEAIDAVLIRMACHGSIRAGERLTREEGEALFRQLDEVDFGGNCPHGRPVYFRMTDAELEKRFDRR